jgi:hypothetical protein
MIPQDFRDYFTQLDSTNAFCGTVEYKSSDAVMEQQLKQEMKTINKLLRLTCRLSYELSQNSYSQQQQQLGISCTICHLLRR